MSQLLIAQYLIGIIGAIEYQPLGQPYTFFQPLQLGVPRWVAIERTEYPGCTLTHQDNYRNEEHIAIIGPPILNGTHLNPKGPYALDPRYYVMKRLTRFQIPRIQRIQIFALLDPQLNPLGPQDPNTDLARYPKQLLSIVCHRPGRIETIDPRSRVWTRRNLRPGACGIEERLIEICLGDQDVGTLDDDKKRNLFVPNPHYPTNPDHYLNHEIGALMCDFFFIIDLPSLTTNNLQLRTMSEIILYYLKGGQRAGYDRVIANGFGLGAGCQPEHLGWDNFVLNDLVTNDFLRRDLLSRTTRQQQINNRHAWYFGKGC